MYANFRKILKQHESIKIPQEIINQLNKDLPKGLEYIQIGENACGITSKEDLKITMNILMPEIHKKYSEIIKNSDDLSEYIYRTQTKLICQPDEDGTITVNNNRINSTDFIKFPLSDKCAKEFGEFSIIPHEFPKIGDMVFKTGDIVKTLCMKRLPYDSMDTIAIESQDDTWVKVRILLYEKTMSATVNFTFRLETIKSVKELIEAIKFNNNIFTYGVSMAGYKLNGKITEDKIIPKENIEFWEKVMLLETILELNFDCSIPVTYNDAHDFEILFRGFIDDKPYREDIKIDSKTGIYFSDKEEIEKQIGQELVMTYIQELDWELLSQKFTIFSVVALFNAIIDSVQEAESANPNDKYFVRLKSVENKTMFQAIKLFKTEAAAAGFQGERIKDFSSFVSMMSNAEAVSVNG